MTNILIIGIVTFLLSCIAIIYILIKVTLENKYTKNYNECLRNLYSNYQENGIIIYIFTFNNKLHFKKFDDIEKYIEFKNVSEKYIKDIEFMFINSYDNCINIQLE